MPYTHTHTHTHTHTLEYYSAIKRNEVESVEVMWMNLESVPRVNSRSINLDVGQGVVQGSPLRGAVVFVFVPGPWQYLTQKLLG